MSNNCGWNLSKTVGANSRIGAICWKHHETKVKTFQCKYILHFFLKICSDFCCHIDIMSLRSGLRNCACKVRPRYTGHGPQCKSLATPLHTPIVFSKHCSSQVTLILSYSCNILRFCGHIQISCASTFFFCCCPYPLNIPRTHTEHMAVALHCFYFRGKCGCSVSISVSVWMTYAAVMNSTCFSHKHAAQ